MVRVTRLSRRNISGVTGVTWHKTLRKWQVHIQADGKLTYLGMFDTVADAAAVRHAAELRLYGKIVEPLKPERRALVSKTGIAGAVPAGGTTFDRRRYAREWVAARRAAWLRDNGPCVQCGSWERLEVDHIDPATKVDHKVWSWAEVRRLAELAKCQVLCHECHLRKTVASHIPDHGRFGRYSRGCRCEPCRAANREHRRKYRRRGTGTMRYSSHPDMT